MQAVWVSELQQLRAMNVNEIRIMKAFQYRISARERIPDEVAAEISSHAESTALRGNMEALEQERRESALSLKASIMQVRAGGGPSSSGEGSWPL